MRHKNVVVLGGSGFIGRTLVNFLVGRGCRVVVPTRRRDHAKHLLPLPTCEVVEVNVFDDNALSRLLTGQQAVINLIGILHGKESQFERVHAELPRRLAAACREQKVRRLLHMSALGASANAPSMYLRSKAKGEAAVQASGLQWTVMKPSVVFGAGDHFLNLFARLARFFPLLPIGGAQARFQPIWVNDVANAFVNSLDNEATLERSYELAGPHIYTLHELVSYAAQAAGHPRWVLELPEAAARLQARLMELAPGEPLLSPDNLDSMKVDNIASRQPYLPAPELELTLTPLEAEAPTYLAGMHARTRFSGFRAHARR